MSDNFELTLYTIYESPTDYPDVFVIRPFIIGKPTRRPEPQEIAFIGKSLEEARTFLELNFPGLVNIGRQISDDPVIVETWI